MKRSWYPRDIFLFPGISSLSLGCCVPCPNISYSTNWLLLVVCNCMFKFPFYFKSCGPLEDRLGLGMIQPPATSQCSWPGPARVWLGLGDPGLAGRFGPGASTRRRLGSVLTTRISSATGRNHDSSDSPGSRGRGESDSLNWRPSPDLIIGRVGPGPTQSVAAWQARPPEPRPPSRVPRTRKE